MMIACSLRTVVSTYLIFMYSGCRPNLYQRGCNRLEGGEIVNPFMSCPIVLSSFSCFQSNFFVIPSLFSVSSYFFKSQFLSFLCFPVNKYSACFEVFIKAIYPSSFLSSHCALFPSGLYLMIILELLLSSILSARPAPFNSSYFFWCCIWFLVAVSFFWLLHSCKWFLVFLWAICSLWHSVSSSPPDSVNDSTIHALMLALVWRMHWIFSFYFWGCDVSFEMCL